MKLRNYFAGVILRPFVARIIGMPGRNRQGSLELAPDQAESRARIEAALHKLSAEIGERNAKNPTNLFAAEKYITNELSRRGYSIRLHSFEFDGIEMSNIEAERVGSSKPDEIVLIGAHYDTVDNSPGADDNASGVAALLEVAERLSKSNNQRTIRLVAFANEENGGNTNGDTMGSAVYARACRAHGDNIASMMSLEMLGCYCDRPGSQTYPSPFRLFYPDVGNFIAFVGKLESGTFVRKCIKKFREVSFVPSEGIAAPEAIRHIHRSDHWGFWQSGYHDALMVTDTANFRNSNYHTASDTVETIDFDRLTQVTAALTEVVIHLLND